MSLIDSRCFLSKMSKKDRIERQAMPPDQNTMVSEEVKRHYIRL